MDEPQVEEVSADFARRWWKSLMANAVALVEDAHALADRGSAGRAQALLVLAMEEVAKARWLYEAAEWEWSAPLGLYGVQPREPGLVQVPDALRTTRAPHAEKLQVAEQFAPGLGGFWDPDRWMEYYQSPDLETFHGLARQRNLDKQAGFYVDRAADRIASPLEIPAGGIVEQIRRTAKVVQMHLIQDHTRQQDASVRSCTDRGRWSTVRRAAGCRRPCADGAGCTGESNRPGHRVVHGVTRRGVASTNPRMFVTPTSSTCCAADTSRSRTS